MSRFSRAKNALIDHLANVVPELFLKHRKSGGGWMVNSPGAARPAADQMKIWKNGGWKDFTAGEQGDAIDLVAYAVFNGVTQETRMDAVKWIEARFGLVNMDPATRARLEAGQAQRQVERARETAERQKANKDRARKLFYSAEENIGGTVADLYLRSRGIDVMQVPNLCVPTFRFHPKATFWTAPKRPTFPALVSKMVDAEGHGRACHLTYLEPDGSGKLDCFLRGYRDSDGKALNSKMMWPETTGLCIRVSDGLGGLSAEQAAAENKPGIVAVTEGIEDALSVAITSPQLRVWAAGSLPNLLHLPDHAAANGYLIYRDNDWHSQQAIALFERCMTRLRHFGKPVEEVSMPGDWGKDVNDALTMEG